MKTMLIKRPAAALIIIVLLVIIVYMNTLGNGFVWDDDILIVNNPVVQNWKNLPALFIQSILPPESQGIHEGGYYRPLLAVSFMIDHSLWGLNPKGFHFSNLFFHCLNVILIAYLLGWIFEKKVAYTAALLFGISPLHTNVVNYVAQRNDSLAALFFLASLLFYTQHRRQDRSGGPLALLGAIVLFCLSLLCKETAVTLPLVLILYDLCFFDKQGGRTNARSFIVYIPFFLILAGYLLLRATILQGGLDLALHSPSDLAYRLATIMKLIASYWVLLLFPVHLSFERVAPVVSSFLDPSFIAALIAICISVILLVHWWRTDKKRCFCLAWFYIAFAPTSNLLPVFPSVANSHLYAAEHFMYLPSIGLFALLASAIPSFADMHEVSGRKRREWRMLLTAGFALVLLYSALTIRRNTDWADKQTFYETTLRSAPNSVRVMNNLGVLYLQQGRREEGLKLFESVLKIDPTSVQAYNNIAAACEDLGRYDRAETAYRKTLSLDERNIRARLGLERILAGTGRIDEATRELSLLVEWYPGLSAAHHELGRLLFARGQNRDALVHFQKALRNSPNPDVVLNSIGIVYATRDELDRAADYFRQAVEANPASYQAHVNLGNVYLGQNRIADAIREYESALASGVDLPGVRDRLEQLRVHQGQGQD